MGRLAELKGNLITACHILNRKGVMYEHGHFSVRCPKEELGKMRQQEDGSKSHIKTWDYYKWQLAQ